MVDTSRQRIIVNAVIKSLVLALSALFAPLYAQTNVWQPSQGHTQLPIWPGTVPDSHPVPAPESMSLSKNLIAGRPWIAVENVSRPTLTVYSPKGTNTDVAVVVFPGGGYDILAIDLEGTEICDWLTSRGITGILLKYRVPTPKLGRYRESLQALQDAQRTLSLVRSHATEWHIDPHKIGVIGFSAGGHLVAATSTHFDKRSYSRVDPADQVSCRPDFAIALYPGHLSPWYPDDPKAWSDTKQLGINPNLTITSNTPPTFLLQAQNDPVDDVRNSMAYSLALRNAKVPVELHLYAEGGHAFGLRRTNSPITAWPELVEKWLKTIGMIPGREPGGFQPE
jgi:acetyl esterase/lipase